MPVLMFEGLMHESHVPWTLVLRPPDWNSVRKETVVRTLPLREGRPLCLAFQLRPEQPLLPNHAAMFNSHCGLHTISGFSDTQLKPQGFVTERSLSSSKEQLIPSGPGNFLKNLRLFILYLLQGTLQNESKLLFSF